MIHFALDDAATGKGVRWVAGLRLGHARKPALCACTNVGIRQFAVFVSAALLVLAAKPVRATLVTATGPPFIGMLTRDRAMSTFGTAARVANALVRAVLARIGANGPVAAFDTRIQALRISRIHPVLDGTRVALRTNTP